MKSGLEIAQEAELLPITQVAQAAGILGFKMLDVKPADGTLYYFVGSDKLRFRQPVL